MSKTHDDLQQELAWVLSQADKAAAAKLIAQTAHDRAFEKYQQQFRDENPELVTALETAEEAHAVAKKRAADVREIVALQLTYAEKIEDLPPGLKQTREKELVIESPGLLVKWLIQFAPVFLMPDLDAIKAWLFASVKDTGSSRSLPEHLASLNFPGYVRWFYKASISDKTLIPLAPANDPSDVEESTPVEADAVPGESSPFSDEIPF